MVLIVVLRKIIGTVESSILFQIFDTMVINMYRFAFYKSDGPVSNDHPLVVLAIHSSTSTVQKKEFVQHEFGSYSSQIYEVLSLEEETV